MDVIGFNWGFCCGLGIGTVYIIAVYEQWRRAYNRLVKKNHELCDRLEENE